MAFIAGTRLGHYEIQAIAGVGGMGEVYRARDTRLQRDVAIKILSPGAVCSEDLRQRFHCEALALSRLNHPNIATIFDCGTENGLDFLVMELIPGVGLDERLAAGRIEEPEILSIAVQLAEALATAHEHGVIHRDLKPANLRITPSGYLKVLDFGLARTLESTASLQTAKIAESVLGTLPYMSPEQLRGQVVDRRTDIYSVGVVLYEMATGSRPFRQSDAAALVAAILNEPVSAPLAHNRRLSLPLNVLIIKAMQRQVEERQQSARELLQELQAINAGAGNTRTRKTRASIDSIAVLPFLNETGSTEADYLSDGITETLISKLATLPRLHVLAHSTVFRYKNVDPVQAAAELKVGSVLTGRVNCRGDELMVSAELVDAAGGWQLWGASYRRKFIEIFAVQDEIAAEIAEQLRPKLSGAERKRLVRRLTDNTEAYELYLRGRFFFNKFSVEGVGTAAEFFTRAIEKDQRYALAYAGLADCYYKQEQYAVLPPVQALSKARSCAEMAISIDENLAEAQASVALVRQALDWDWNGAEAAFQRALHLNPNFAHARHMYSHLLMALGRVEESFRESQCALQTDPLEPSLRCHLGWHLYNARQYEAAVTELRRALAMEPGFRPAHALLGLALLETNKVQEAVEVLERAPSVHRTPETLAALGYAYGKSGRAEQAHAIAAQMQDRAQFRHVSSYFVALVYIGLDDLEKALQWFERACDQHESSLMYLYVDPKHDRLRSHSQFDEMVCRLSLKRA